MVAWEARWRAASVDRVHGRVGAATSIQPGSPSVCPSPLERQPRRPGANTFSLVRHPEGILGFALGQGLHRSSPLTTGVTAGVGRSGARLSDALRVASARSRMLLLRLTDVPDLCLSPRVTVASAARLAASHL